MNSLQRGEVWLVDPGMTAKGRPALVISVPTSDVDRALVTVVPHTSSPRNSRFEVAISVSFLRTGVFDAQNLVTIPHAKLLRQLGRLSDSHLASVERAIQLWLGSSDVSSQVVSIPYCARSRFAEAIASSTLRTSPSSCCS